MATKKRKKAATATTSRKTSPTRKKSRKKGTGRRKGLAGVTTVGGTAMQKLTYAGLLALSAVAGGLTGSFIGNEYNGPAGLLGAGVGSVLLPEQFRVPAIVAGVTCALTQAKLPAGTVPASINGIQGIEGFGSDGIARMKNYTGEIAEKAYVGTPVKKALGLSGMEDADYNPYTSEDAYAQMMREAFKGKSVNQALLAGNQNSNALLAGISKNALTF